MADAAPAVLITGATSGLGRYLAPVPSSREARRPCGSAPDSARSPTGCSVSWIREGQAADGQRTEEDRDADAAARTSRAARAPEASAPCTEPVARWSPQT
jgi:hypothetical protein